MGPEKSVGIESHRWKQRVIRVEISEIPSQLLNDIHRNRGRGEGTNVAADFDDWNENEEQSDHGDRVRCLVIQLLRIGPDEGRTQGS